MSNRPPINISSSDIPQAQRQPTEISFAEIEKASTPAAKPKPQHRGLMMGLLMLAALTALGVWQWNNLSYQALAIRNSIAAGRLSPQSGNESAGQNPDSTSGSDGTDSTDRSALPTESPTEVLAGVPDEGLKTPDLTSSEAATDAAKLDRPQTLLNHRRYDEASQQDLVLLNPTSDVKLQPAAQASINAMIAKAQAEGIQLGVASGFRSIEDQNYLYFKVKAERGETAQTRAAVSAPPGYSEHHTGYAVDLIDESKPQTHLEESFETTPAYQWLKQNAAFFNFEMSFPKNNESQVAYEPWHWRYVGDQDSLETFYKN